VGSQLDPRRESQTTQFASLFALTPVATCVVDAATGRIAEANVAAGQLLGYTRETLVGRYLRSLLHFAEPGQVGALAVSWSRKEAFDLRLVLAGRDGSALPVQASGRPMLWDGQPAAIVVFEPADDLRGEAALVGLVSAAHEAIITMDDDLVIQTANPAALAMFRARVADVVGRPFERFVPRQYRAEYGAVLVGMGIAGDLPRPATNEMLLLRADGEAFVAAAGITRAPSVCVGMVIRDVTAERETESALRETQQRLEVLTAVAPVGIVRADPEGICIYLNAEACEVLGCSRDLALGRRWTSFVHRDDALLHSVAWERARVRGLPFEAVYRVVRPGGEARWINARARAEIDEDGDVRSYIGAFVDVTERELQGSDAIARAAGNAPRGIPAP
jgi:PAS domain S-box-containing protein